MFFSSSNSSLLFSIFISALILFTNVETRGGRRGGKGRGKTNLQFAQVAEFSLISSQLPDNRVNFKYLKENYIFSRAPKLSLALTLVKYSGLALN